MQLQQPLSQEKREEQEEEEAATRASMQVLLLSVVVVAQEQEQALQLQQLLLGLLPLQQQQHHQLHMWVDGEESLHRQQCLQRDLASLLQLALPYQAVVVPTSIINNNKQQRTFLLHPPQHHLAVVLGEDSLSCMERDTPRRLLLLSCLNWVALRHLLHMLLLLHVYVVVVEVQQVQQQQVLCVQDSYMALMMMTMMGGQDLMPLQTMLQMRVVLPLHLLEGHGAVWQVVEAPAQLVVVVEEATAEEAGLELLR